MGTAGDAAPTTEAGRPRPADLLAEAVAYTGTDCLLWRGRLSPDGYGLVTIGDRTHNAHRVVLKRTVGPPPTPRHQAGHAPIVCHEPACVTPAHLRWVTPAENCADRTRDRLHAWVEAGQLQLPLEAS